MSEQPEHQRSKDRRRHRACPGGLTAFAPLASGRLERAWPTRRHRPSHAAGSLAVQDPASHEGRGLTLVEVLIAVTVMAILASVALPALGNSASAKLRGAARVLAGDIYYVQSLAIGQGKLFAMDFSEGNQYQVVDPNRMVNGGPAVLAYPTGDYPLHDGQYVVDFDDPGPLRGVAIASASFSGQQRLEFGPYGGPVHAGEVILRCGRQQVRIQVAPTTGRVQIGGLEGI